MDSKKDLQSRHSISLKPSISDLQDALICFINIINFCTNIITYCEFFSIKVYGKGYKKWGTFSSL